MRGTIAPSVLGSAHAVTLISCMLFWAFNTQAAELPSLVSTADPTVQASAVPRHSGAPALTADGRYVAFVSALANLTPELPTGVPNIFLRDRLTGATTLVSVGADGAQANQACSSPIPSEDGRFVLFISRASNLVPDTANGWEQVYVRDLLEQRTELVSANTNGLASYGPASNARMTPNGRFVVFDSPARDLTDQDLNNTWDVFLHDLTQHRTLLISVNAEGTGPGDGTSRRASISDNGQLIVFESSSYNLVTNEFAGVPNVFVRNLGTGTTTALCISPSAQAPSYTWNGQISGDGRWVLFETDAPGMAESDLDLRYNDIFLRDLQTGATWHVSPGLQFDRPEEPAAYGELSHDGSRVLFGGHPVAPGAPLLNVTNTLYAWSTDVAEPLPFPRSWDDVTPANGLSLYPVLSDDGNTVIFLSNAGNLSAEATSGTMQVYRHDLQSHSTTLVSVNLDGNGNNLDCSGATTRDGNLIAFSSLEPDLTLDDGNDLRDVFVRDLAQPQCERLSRTTRQISSVTPSGASRVGDSPLSGDGTLVAFTSTADDLVPLDHNGHADVFVRNLTSGGLALVSVNTNGFGANADSVDAVMSRDGHFVAFLSRATDLTRDGTNGVTQLYLRDLAAETTTLVSRSPAGRPAFYPPANPSISGDGRLLCYDSEDDTLVGLPLDGHPDVFIFDRITGTQTLVSATRFGDTGNNLSMAPRITPDGASVLFRSLASDLTPEPGGGRTSSYLYARNLVSGLTTRLTLRAYPAIHPVALHPSATTPDSHLTAFTVSNDSTQPPELVVFNLETGWPANPSHPGSYPVLNADGRFVAFEDTDGIQVRVWDRLLNADILVSMNHEGTGGGNGRSFSPLLTPDGRFAVFASRASDLVPDDTNHATDIFVRDLLLGRTTRLSTGLAGTSGNRHSTHPVLGPDGRTLVFESAASDLVPDDRNLATDLFLIRLGSPDSDGDQLDDDWERTHFDDLSRDGTGDFDQDGLTDREEFLMGSDPRADSPRLIARSITRLSDGQTTVTWDSAPGRTYQVQYLDQLVDSTWQSAPGTVTLPGTTGLYTDTSAAPSRFYRVVLVAP